MSVLRSFSLTVPTSDGVGAAAVVSGLGREKYVVIAGTLDANASIIVEASAAASGSDNFCQVLLARKPGVYPVTAIARRMRVRVRGLRPFSPFLPTVEVVGEWAFNAFDTVVATAGNGTGASVDLSNMAMRRSVFVTGTFSGSLELEASNDNTNWAIVKTFTAGGCADLVMPAKFLRLTRSNINPYAPGLPTVHIGATGLDGGGKWGWNQKPDPVDLVWDAAGIDVDASLGNVFLLELGGATAQINNATGYEVGQSWMIYAIQVAGNETITWDAQWSFGDSAAPDLSSYGAGIVAIFSCTAVAANKVAVVANPGF